MAVQKVIDLLFDFATLPGANTGKALVEQAMKFCSDLCSAAGAYAVNEWCEQWWTLGSIEFQYGALNQRTDDCCIAIWLALCGGVVPGDQIVEADMSDVVIFAWRDLLWNTEVEHDERTTGGVRGRIEDWLSGGGAEYDGVQSWKTC